MPFYKTSNHLFHNYRETTCELNIRRDMVRVWCNHWLEQSLNFSAISYQVEGLYQFSKMAKKKQTHFTLVLNQGDMTG